MNLREMLRGVRMRLTLEKTQFPITVEGFVGGSDPPNVYIGEVDISPDVISVDIDAETPVAQAYDGSFLHTGERYITLTLRLRVKQATAKSSLRSAADLASRTRRGAHERTIAPRTIVLTWKTS